MGRRGGGVSSSTGTTAQRLRGLWCVRLWSRCCSPIWLNSPLFSLLFNAFPSALPLPTPSFLPTDITEESFATGTATIFSPDMTTRGSLIAMGPALRNAGQLLGVFGPFLCILSLSLPTSDLIYTRTPHYQHPRVDTAELLQPHPLVRRLTAQTRVTYSRDPRFTGV